MQELSETCRKELTGASRQFMLEALSHYTGYKMITKEQALNSLENLNNPLLMESEWNRSQAAECLTQYIEQMETILEVVVEIVEASGITYNSKVFDAIDKLEATLKEIK